MTDVRDESRWEAVHDLGAQQGEIVIDYRNGMKQRVRLIGPSSLRFDPVAHSSESPPTYMLVVQQDSVGGHALAWPDGVRRREGRVHPVELRPGWSTIYVVYRMPFGLCVDVPTYFEPVAAMESVPPVG
jgi:hypothetical protein